MDDKSNLKSVLTKVAETMDLAAKHFKDKGSEVYTAQLHCSAAGLALSRALKGGMEPTATNIGAVFHATYNHSAWRQKFEKAGYFPKATERSLDTVIEGLEEEFGEGE